MLSLRGCLDAGRTFLLMGESTGEVWWVSDADTHAQCGERGDQSVEKIFYVKIFLVLS